MPPWTFLAAALLDLAAPERCVLCGAASGTRPWCARGGPAPGLRALDAPHLCRGCAGRLSGDPFVTTVLPGCPPVHAARPTDADLVALVGAWKYHGVRGLAWPLAGLLLPAARRLVAGLPPGPVLVPVPLHRRRLRTRGFNQAFQLAHLVGAALGCPVADVLERRRATGQQARLADDRARRGNLAGSCRLRPDAPPPAGPLVLVDDIVTSGATLAEAARALAAAGRPAAAALAAGLRAGPG